MIFYSYHDMLILWNYALKQIKISSMKFRSNHILRGLQFLQMGEIRYFESSIWNGWKISVKTCSEIDWIDYVIANSELLRNGTDILRQGFAIFRKIRALQSIPHICWKKLKQFENYLKTEENIVRKKQKFWDFIK